MGIRLSPSLWTPNLGDGTTTSYYSLFVVSAFKKCGCLDAILTVPDLAWKEDLLRIGKADTVLED